ncbi:MAG: TSUP family transporter [Planctomycetota bacterium]
MGFGAVVQGAVGFGSGLLGVPLLVMAGFSLPESAAINFISTSIQNAAGAWKLAPHLDRQDLLLPTVVRIAMLPVGVAALGLTGGLQPATVRQIVGAVLLASVAMLRGVRLQPRDRLGLGWRLAAFSSSGFLMGFAAIGGAPMVMYVNALTWSAQKSRGFLFFCSAVCIPPLAALFAYRFGRTLLPATLAALLVLPIIAACLAIGLRLGHRLDKQRFRRITYGLITAIAVASITGPWLIG